MSSLKAVGDALVEFDNSFKRPGINNLPELFVYVDLTSTSWAKHWAADGALRIHAEFPCVYFFFDGNKLLQYIGKAEVFGKRMFQHFDMKDAKWKDIAEGIGILPIPKEHWFEISAIEAYLIRTLSPPQNTVGI